MKPSMFLPLLFLQATSSSESSDKPDYWLLMERAIEINGAGAQFTEALDHIQSVTARRPLDHRLSAVTETLDRPWQTPALATTLRAGLSAPVTSKTGARFTDLAANVATLLDLNEPEAEDPVVGEFEELWWELESEELTGRLLLDVLSEYVGLAHFAVAEALDGIAPDRRQSLFRRHREFCEAWYRSHFPEAELTEQQEDILESFREDYLSTPRQDRRRLLHVAQATYRLAELDFVEGLAKRLSGIARNPQEGSDEDVIAVAGDTAWERVVLTGRRSSVHQQPAALTIDLGGNDRYERAAVVETPEMLASIVLELDGDDVYESASPGPAYAAGGVALLVDVRGEDEYRSKRLGQGATVLGHATLVDWQGDDEYVLEDYGQGHALCGVGLLYDFDGDDDYRAWAFAQGGGIGYGLSALVDGTGDDRYLADLHWPDVYGNSGPDIYHGASQGYCTGMRPEIPGGLAALLDLGNGKDRYQAGNFSQGGGYYFAFGLMFDGGGDDQNFGTRYSQGFGVHQAAGVRWDAGGDDEYACRSVAHAGMAWDEGIGFFLEDDGNDTYQVGGLGLGGAAQTGIAVCIDRNGRDRYQSANSSQGGTGGSEYHDKPSIAVLFDLGGDGDDYSVAGNEDDLLRVADGVGVFLDTRARNCEKAMRSSALRSK